MSLYYIFYRTGIDVESAAAGEPAANLLLQQMIQQINTKINELTGEDMFPIRLKLTDFSRDLMVSLEVCLLSKNC